MSTDALTMETLSSDMEEADLQDIFRVDVGGYEGPLHLLLELARRQKVDLLHLSMLDLAEQYLVFIEDAKKRRMDLAADYLLMASWLAFMKSRLLLPKPEKIEEDEPTGEEMAARLAAPPARCPPWRRPRLGCDHTVWARVQPSFPLVPTT